MSKMLLVSFILLVLVIGGLIVLVPRSWCPVGEQLPAYRPCQDVLMEKLSAVGLGTYCHGGFAGETHCHWFWEAEHIH